MKLASRFELSKDAQDRDDMNYEVLLNKRNNNHIQNAIKECQRHKDKIEMKYQEDEDIEEESQQTGAYQLKRK